MKLLEIWKRIGKQPLRITRQKDAVVFLGGKEYKISNIVYDRGQFIGFNIESSNKVQWYNKSIKPEPNKWIIVKDADDGKEYDDHQWNGHTWYAYVRNNDGTCDGWRTNVNVESWRYQEEQ